MSAMQRSSGSAAQPAVEVIAAAKKIQDVTSEQLAGYSNFYRLGFYNIGWNITSRKHSKENLATEICDMVRDKRVDAVGISEVFNLREHHQEKRQDIMEHLLEKLNSSAGQPATSTHTSNIWTAVFSVQPVWMGRLDGHYIFVWNSYRLTLVTYEYISCGVAEHPWRMAQYLQFRHEEAQNGPPLHICHCHSPSSKKGDLSDGRRKTIFKALWSHVMRNAHSDIQSSAAQPVAVFGGDFNSDYLTWTFVLKDANDTQDSRRRVQECTSAKFESHHGDRAMVFNAWAVQEDSRWGKNHPRAGKPKPFSDAHDVVLVPLCWRRYASFSSSSAAQPARESVHPAAESQWLSAAKSSSSAAQPAVLPYAPKSTPGQRPRRWFANASRVSIEAGSQVLTEAHTSNSAAQPASSSDRPKAVSPGDVEAGSSQVPIEAGSQVSTEAQPGNSDAQPARTLVDKLTQPPITAQCSATPSDSAAQPASPFDAPSDSAAQPAPPLDAPTSSSAAQPASPVVPPQPISCEDSEDAEAETMQVAAPSFIIPTQATPLYDGLLERLAGTGGDEHTFETLAKCFIWGKLKFKSPYGSAAQPVDKMDDPYELGLRMEHLLDVTNTQRSLHIARLAYRGDPRADSPKTLIFTGKDMAETMNDWRHRPETWSNATEALKELSTNQEHHLAGKNKFNAMVFEIFGNRKLVEHLIQFPIGSAEQPGPMLREFVQSWKTAQNSEEAQRARERSQKKEPGTVRLSKRIKNLRDKESHGKKLADWIQEDRSNWHKLRKADQRIWTDFAEGKISKEISELRQQQQQERRSAGAAAPMPAVPPVLNSLLDAEVE